MPREQNNQNIKCCQIYFLNIRFNHRVITGTSRVALTKMELRSLYDFYFFLIFRAKTVAILSVLHGFLDAFLFAFCKFLTAADVRRSQCQRYSTSIYDFDWLICKNPQNFPLFLPNFSWTANTSRRPSLGAYINLLRN